MNTKRLVLLIVCAVMAAGLLAQKPSAISLFMSDSIRHVRLKTDMKELVKGKYKEEYQPAILEIYQDSGDTTSIELEIRSRGNIRKEVCYFPPIKLKFPKSDYTYYKLKWVNVCRDSDVAQEYLLKEFLAYKIFAEITDKSFKTHLLMVDYVDTGRDNKTFRQLAFVLENEDALADRLGGRVHEPRIMKEEYLDREQLALFTLFEYLIANTDYSFGNRHNIEIVTSPSTNTLLCIPYDFDYSGFVGTTYAVPHETVPIESVTTRYNNSFCLTEDELHAARKGFLDKKDKVLALCDSIKAYDERTGRESRSFIEEFFDDLENEKLMVRAFVKQCQEMED